jgi:diadenosine tetraphosphate (Ap4A) HIT family hydrolase
MKETAMMAVRTTGFALDARLEADSEPIIWLGLCELRLINDCRWPWVVLVPQRAGVEEIHELTPLDQAMLTFETNMVAHAMKEVTRCTKINSGALGNIVRQLHVHVVARSEDDPGWPGPVWGHGVRKPYRLENLHHFSERLRQAL